MNWCQLMNFWCHLINIWGHVLLTIYEKRRDRKAVKRDCGHNRSLHVSNKKRCGSCKNVKMHSSTLCAVVEIEDETSCYSSSKLGLRCVKANRSPSKLQLRGWRDAEALHFDGRGCSWPVRHKFDQQLPKQLSFWRGALTLLEEHDVLAGSSCVLDVGKETFSCSLQWQCTTISHYETAVSWRWLWQS